MFRKNRMNSSMELLLLLLTLQLASSTPSEEMPYEHFLAQLQACPKECRCPASFPRIVYCDHRDLKTMPNVPPYTWYLYLQNNQIEAIPEKALQNATQLKWLNLNHNKITDQGVEAGALKGLTSLVHLWIEDNLLTTIPSQLPTSLEQLILARNKISKIPAGVFSGMDHLALLDLQGNELGDEAVSEQSLKGLSSLVQVNLAKNNLKAMPPGLPESTVQLYLDSNDIDKIPDEYFKGLPKMAFLRLNYNKLGNGGLPKNIFNLPSILDLQLSYNQLTEIPPFPLSLEHLHLDHNKISRLNGTEICPVPNGDSVNEDGPRLSYLRLDGNEIKPPIAWDLMVCFRLLRAFVI